MSNILNIGSNDDSRCRRPLGGPFAALVLMHNSVWNVDDAATFGSFAFVQFGPWA
jgi:hypothetical protein